MTDIRRQFIEVIPPCPPHFSDQGIVIAAGGDTLLPCLWVLLHRLQATGCSLPVEVWHLGEDEMPGDIRKLLSEKFPSATLVDALAVRERHPVKILKGWELKVFAMLHCSFKEVLLLDADNVPMVDPTSVFQNPDYLDRGALFWPDQNRHARGRKAWRAFGLTPAEEDWEVESGQVLVNKGRHWRALNLAMHLNEHSDYYYRLFYGDKESFYFAWKLLNEPFAMAPHPMQRLQQRTMIQFHPTTGELLFQHRHGAKWRISHNPRIHSFNAEEECLTHLSELRQLWPTGVERLRRQQHDGEKKILRQFEKEKHYALKSAAGECHFLSLGQDGVIHDSSGTFRWWHPHGSRLVLQTHDHAFWEFVCEDDAQGVWQGVTQGAFHGALLSERSDGDDQIHRRVTEDGHYAISISGISKRANALSTTVTLQSTGLVADPSGNQTGDWGVQAGNLHLRIRGTHCLLKANGSDFLGECTLTTRRSVKLASVKFIEVGPGPPNKQTTLTCRH
ncbi:hypothetical protein [Verrucomicrobium sp. BvORR034]|uniref:hypothetical protein n=1 Tax=Verrucomicrobium sp. BvORR034 TaxID=1396418 RepID=UPI0006791E55|nr:hypothetical protein [Verrucomicrobium sp. BvORR034]